MLALFQTDGWDIYRAAHLINRAGFGAPPSRLVAIYRRGFPAALEDLLVTPDDSADHPRPEWAQPRDMLALRREMRGADEQTRQMKLREMRRAEVGHVQEMRLDWLARMRNSPAPLREKMTLFWHGHFATSMEKVRDSYHMWRQIETLRSGALGNFRDLTKRVSRDPAMMIWLDTRQSQRGKPNENFARELMELFTLGEGNYTEDDVKEAARAFTGYRIHPTTGEFLFLPRDHDDGEKSVLGRRGALDGDAVIDRIFELPQCAKFLCRKLWEFFAYEDPEPEIVEALAATFRAADYEMKPLLRDLFGSAAFFSGRALRTQIKSPVQWLVQASLELESDLPDSPALPFALRQLGQNLLEPPSVKGWDGGKAWISTSSLLQRYNLAGALVKGDGWGDLRRGGGREGIGAARSRGGFRLVDLDAVAPPELRRDPKELVDLLVMRLFQTRLAERDTRAFHEYLAEHGGDTSDATVAGLIHLMMSTPQYQIT